MFHVKHFLLLTLLFVAGAALAQQGPWYGGQATGTAYPNGSTPVVAAVNSTNGAITLNLPAVAGKTTFICGFSATSSGNNGASNFNIQVLGLVPNSVLIFAYEAPANGQGVLIVPFRPCIPAGSPASSIPITMPAAGTGSSQALSAWGYQSGT